MSIKNGCIKQRIYWLRDLGFLLLRERLEEQTARCLDSIIMGYQPRLFLDLGANVGFYFWRAHNLDPQMLIWMFEPDRTNIALITQTIKFNKLNNIRLFPVAVSNEQGEMMFLLDPISGKTGSVVDQRLESGTLHHSYGLELYEMVKCVNLDSLLSIMPRVKVLIKVDVEGAEDLVFQGAKSMLGMLRPVIIFESFDLEKLNWLKEYDYVITDLHEKGNYVTYPKEEKTIERLLAG